MTARKTSGPSGWPDQLSSHQGDSSEEALKRRCLVTLSVQLGTGAIAWAGVCVLADSGVLLVAVPLAHLAATALLLFLVTRRHMTVGRGLTLLLWLGVVLPCVFQMLAGGLAATGGIVMWSVTPLVASANFSGRAQARAIFATFLGMVLILGVLDALFLTPTAGLLTGGLRSAAFVVNAAGMALGLVALVDLIAANHERVRAALKAANQVELDFLSTVSHEMRTPLTSILGFTEVIRKKLEKTVFPAVGDQSPKVDQVVSQVRGNLRVMTTEGRRLTDLVDVVLDLHLMECDAITWKKEKVIVEDLVEHAAAMCSVLLMDRPEVAYEQHLGPDMAPLEGDVERLLQVLVNLLSNAIKFTEEGSVRLTAASYRQGAEAGAEISVADSGPGIRREDLDVVFDHFRQVGDSQEKVAGSGLGLTIAKKIVEAHGGRIWATSEVGQGATFTLRIPYR